MHVGPWVCVWRGGAGLLRVGISGPGSLLLVALIIPFDLKAFFWILYIWLADEGQGSNGVYRVH